LLRAEWGSDSELFFIEGADSLAEIVTWYQPQKLLELCDLAVVERPGFEVDLAFLERELPGIAPRIHWIQMPGLEISSSDLRARVQVGRPISYLVPSLVERHILERGLYRS
jgi:nicotinate-nucleotide adenylyltransferase